MQTKTERRTKITLKDEERSRIRWSSTKRGFIPWLEFSPSWNRRGVRPIRPLRGKVHVVQEGALTEVIALAERELYVGRTRQRAVVAEQLIYEVDHLGNVVAVHEV